MRSSGVFTENQMCIYEIRDEEAADNGNQRNLASLTEFVIGLDT